MGTSPSPTMDGRSMGERSLMQYARAVIAAVLATGLVIIVFIQESSDFGDGSAAVDDALDPTFLLLALAIILLTIPDALAYIRRKQEPEDKEDE